MAVIVDCKSSDVRPCQARIDLIPAIPVVHGSENTLSPGPGKEMAAGIDHQARDQSAFGSAGLLPEILSGQYHGTNDDHD